MGCGDMGESFCTFSFVLILKVQGLLFPCGQRGESPTKVIAIFEGDELKTSLPIAPGLDISGDDEFLH